MNTSKQLPLGRAVDWPREYDPGLLFAIERAEARKALGLEGRLPFHGQDLWNAYEFSWIRACGKPEIAILRIRVPADSPCLIESKSLKLYLGAFANLQWADVEALKARIEQDLARVAQAPVRVQLTPRSDFPLEQIESLGGDCIDDEPLELAGPETRPRPDRLQTAGTAVVEETLVSHLFRSICPVTGQPDWASIQIRYRGPTIRRDGLLHYLVSFRQQSGFHEDCVERIFCDLQAACQPEWLTVCARFTRRGGLDINPWRSNVPGTPPNPRLARQ